MIGKYEKDKFANIDKFFLVDMGLKLKIVPDS
jgi:hypothetical protein